MFRRTALGLTGFLLLMLAWAPASWLAPALESLTQQRLLLTRTSGSIWSGAGDFWLQTPGKHTLHLLAHKGWHFEFSALLRGELRWQLEGETRPGSFFINWQESGVQDLQLPLPAAALSLMLPPPLNRLGWRGDLLLDAPQWACAHRQKRCRGNASLIWQGAGSDLLPQQRLGDFRLQGEADGSLTHVRWETLRGEVQTRGEARLGDDTLSLAGTINSKADWLSRLPQISQGWVVAGPLPGEYRVSGVIPLHSPRE